MITIQKMLKLTGAKKKNKIKKSKTSHIITSTKQNKKN